MTVKTHSKKSASASVGLDFSKPCRATFKTCHLSGSSEKMQFIFIHLVLESIQFQRALQYSLPPPGSVWPLLCERYRGLSNWIWNECRPIQITLWRLHPVRKSPLCCIIDGWYACVAENMICVSLSDVTFTHPEALMWKGCFSEVSFISDDSKCLFFLNLIVAFLLDDCNKKPKGRHQPYYMIPVAPADVGLDPTITGSDG